MGTGIELLALGLAGYGMYKQHRTQKKALEQQEAIAKREASKAPEAATEQKKIDTAAKIRSAIQSNMLAGARKGSTATGGTTLG